MEEKFIEFMLEKRLAENTYLSYVRDLKIFKKYYNDSYGEELSTLNRADVSMYVNYMKKNGISAKSINRKLAALKQYNLFLVSEGIQDEVIIIDKDYIKMQKSRIPKVIPTEQEINKLKHFACKDEKNAKRDYCFISIYVYGGLRESEMVNLKITDIHLDGHFINVIGKGNKFRQVMINNLMYDAIKEYLEERLLIAPQNPYLFIGQKNQFTDKPLSRNYGNRLLNKYKDLCKIAKLHPHILRAYFCSNALHNAGFSIEQVADQAGHSSLNTTREYLSSTMQTLLDLANNL